MHEQSETDSAKVWLTFTQKEGITHQREAQLTWWSILQGIAMGEFVVRLPSIWTTAWSSRQYYFLAFMLTTFLLLANIWIQMSWAIIILRWPLRASHTLLTSLAGIVSVFLATTMDNPVHWVGALFSLACVAVLVYLYNLKAHTYLGMPEGYGKRTIGESLVYLVIAGALWRIVSVQGSTFWYYVAGVFGVLLSFYTFFVQSKRMEYERRRLSLL